MDMTAVEHAREIGAAAAPAATLTRIQDKVADLLPPVMIAAGLVLTVAWTAGLLGLLALLI
jgi:hypothetical protein